MYFVYLMYLECKLLNVSLPLCTRYTQVPTIPDVPSILGARQIDMSSPSRATGLRGFCHYKRATSRINVTD